MFRLTNKCFLNSCRGNKSKTCGNGVMRIHLKKVGNFDTAGRVTTADTTSVILPSLRTIFGHFRTVILEDWLNYNTKISDRIETLWKIQHAIFVSLMLEKHVKSRVRFSSLNQSAADDFENTKSNLWELSINENTIIEQSWKHWSKRGNCSPWAIFLFVVIFLGLLQMR